MKFVGSSKVSSKLRISIVKDVADKMGVNDGDTVMFYEDDKGNILLKKA
jgi:AbrB family looped-hinge helix DNA binding protein